MTTTVKRGDATTLTFDLGVDLTGYTAARVIIAARTGAAPIVDRAGVIAGQTVTIALTATDTAVAGTYQCEVELAPGPHTHPSDGTLTLVIVPDLG